MITFVISDEHNYAEYMPDDAGPRFAAMYSWRTVRLSECSFQHDQIYVVDWYLTDAEFDTIRLAMLKRPSALFSFHVIDPWIHIRGTPAHRFMVRHFPMENAILSGPYPPAENIAHIYARTGRFVHTPYLYEQERELPIDHSRRKKSVLLSGNIGANDYPIRALINLNAKLNPLFWGRIQRLQHSGYWMSTLRHALVREQFIEKLSEYRFAVVCSSRLGLEFLKYRELAYAGCVPVGDLAGTLLDCPSGAYVPWRRNFFKTLKDLDNPETEKSARAFRDFMSKHRNREAWRRRVCGRFKEYQHHVHSGSSAAAS